MKFDEEGNHYFVNAGPAEGFEFVSSAYINQKVKELSEREE